MLEWGSVPNPRRWVGWWIYYFGHTFSCQFIRNGTSWTRPTTYCRTDCIISRSIVQLWICILGTESYRRIFWKGPLGKTLSSSVELSQQLWILPDCLNYRSQRASRKQLWVRGKYSLERDISRASSSDFFATMYYSNFLASNPKSSFGSPVLDQNLQSPPPSVSTEIWNASHD